MKAAVTFAVGSRLWVRGRVDWKPDTSSSDIGVVTGFGFFIGAILLLVSLMNKK